VSIYISGQQTLNNYWNVYSWLLFKSIFMILISICSRLYGNYISYSKYRDSSRISCIGHVRKLKVVGRKGGGVCKLKSSTSRYGLTATQQNITATSWNGSLIYCLLLVVVLLYVTITSGSDFGLKSDAAQRA